MQDANNDIELLLWRRSAGDVPPDRVDKWAASDVERFGQVDVGNVDKPVAHRQKFAKPKYPAGG